MGTIAENIISNHVGKGVRANDIVVCPVDFMMSQDGTTPLTIRAFKEMNGKKVAMGQAASAGTPSALLAAQSLSNRARAGDGTDRYPKSASK